jgi:hypothetical protein
MGAYLDEALKRLEKYGSASDTDLARLAESMPNNAQIDAMRQTNPSVTTGTMSDSDFQRMLAASEVMKPTIRANGSGAMSDFDYQALQNSYNNLMDMNSNIGVYPMSGILNSMNNASVVGRNMVTAPNAFPENSLNNVATGNSNVSPYGLGLGQQMYGTGQMSDQEKQILGILGQ